MKRYAAAAGVAAVALAGAGYWAAHRRQAAAPAPKAESAYVDARTCAGCHAAIYRTYRETGMGRSFSRARAEDLPAGSRVTYYHRASDRTYAVQARDGKIIQRRAQAGYQGSETNVIERPADFVIGSGNHARSYLHFTPAGKLIELPLSWYAEKGGYWAMSPGFDRPNHQDFRRAILQDCMFCHNGYPTSEANAGGDASGAVFREPIPEGIDCQRCHGPGRAHVEAAGSGRASSDAIRRAILNPASLSRDRQLEVCFECHLETTSRPLPHQIRRYNRAPFSYRPGEPLEDVFLFFDYAPGSGREDRFDIAHAAYRLRKSACFTGSSMTCTTCHNPHQAPRGEAATRHYTKICQNCHPAAHAAAMPAGGDCISCHMPKRRAEDAVHVVMTDHYIQRRKPARDLLAPIAEVQETDNPYRGEVVLYYPPRLPQTPENELYLAVAQVQQGSNLKMGIARLEQAISKHRPEGPEFYFELGEAHAKSGNRQAAVRWFDEALRRRPEFRPALQELAVTLIAAGELPRATQVLERLAASPDVDPVMLTNLGNVYLRQGSVERAGQVLLRALGMDADLPGANNLMGLVRSRQGDRAGAETHLRNAIRSQPDLAEAHYNLANLLAGGRDYAQSRYHFEKAIAHRPEYVEAHHGYAILLLLLKQYDRAAAQLRETIRLDPNRAQAHYDLGDVLAATGKADAAAGQYRLAIQANPEFSEAHLALGMILVGRGGAAQARQHFEHAARSTDPAVRQAALDAMK